MNLSRIQKGLQSDEGGQVFLEYILILSLVIGVFFAAFKTFLKPAYARLSRDVSQAIDQEILKVDLHRFPFRR